MPKTAIILALMFSILLLGSCGGGTNTNSNGRSDTANSNISESDREPKTNVEELSVLVNVPYKAEDIVWKSEAQQKRLIAVLRFSPADSAKIVAEAEKLRATAGVSLQSEVWFPDELIAQSDMSGDDTLHGIAYGADMFLLPPYNEGRLIRIDGTEYFVLEASIR